MCGMKDLNKELENFQLEYTRYNKPFFSNLDLKFNISHSGNLVLCAISEIFDIGIDVELMNDIDIENFRNQMTLYEWKKISQGKCRKIAFYEYWTEKEAVLKAIGKGLSVPLKSFEVKNNLVKIDNYTFFIQKVEINKEYKISLAYKIKRDLIITPNIKLIRNEFY